ncbi:hypothetical protein T10_12883 [Trichinella papuae]|uniref:Uncharacterized protein n=1 Tax=Trichinella papuae TaxID=268474 RepID=A0A0V1MED3_9BILA|nr:hypothetical protein T10_2721 [Trichinella papuae]KRZ70224.1 hypothetical protein T10_12883 [Trichinella papuae]
MVRQSLLKRRDLRSQTMLIHPPHQLGTVDALCRSLPTTCAVCQDEHRRRVAAARRSLCFIRLCQGHRAKHWKYYTSGMLNSPLADDLPIRPANTNSERTGQLSINTAETSTFQWLQESSCPSPVGQHPRSKSNPLPDSKGHSLRCKW